MFGQAMHQLDLQCHDAGQVGKRHRDQGDAGRSQHIVFGEAAGAGQPFRTGKRSEFFFNRYGRVWCRHGFLQLIFMH